MSAVSFVPRSTFLPVLFLFFFFNDTATTEIYTLSLHDALPISPPRAARSHPAGQRSPAPLSRTFPGAGRRRRSPPPRSEEHTSELQSRLHLVCRLLLEKKKKQQLLHTLTVPIVRRIHPLARHYP